MSGITLESLAAAFAQKDQEIERLKVENETLRAANALFEGGMHWRNGLITELCNALEARNQLSDTPLYLEAVAEVLQRSREVTHGT